MALSVSFPPAMSPSPEVWSFRNRPMHRAPPKEPQFSRLLTNVGGMERAECCEIVLFTVRCRFKTNSGERGRKGSGAARGIRTPDPVITNDVLYRLSYCGGPRAWI